MRSGRGYFTTDRVDGGHCVNGVLRQIGITSNPVIKVTRSLLAVSILAETEASSIGVTPNLLYQRAKMKITHLTVTASLLVGAYAPCPFQTMKRSGQLSEEDAAKFEAMKRDPRMAEVLFEAYQKEKRDAAT